MDELTQEECRIVDDVSRFWTGFLSETRETVTRHATIAVLVNREEKKGTLLEEWDEPAIRRQKLAEMAMHTISKELTALVGLHLNPNLDLHLNSHQ
jgi:hypothetical protein